MTNSVDPDQTAPRSSTLFASLLKLVSNVKQLFAAYNFSRRHFSDGFFLGALRVKYKDLIILTYDFKTYLVIIFFYFSVPIYPSTHHKAKGT